MTLALEPQQQEYIVAQMDPEDALEVIRGALASGVRSFDFDRVKVPAGGGASWEVPSLDGDHSEKALTGIVVGIAWKKAYWQASVDESGGGSPPDCRSDDGLIGIGNPGGACKRCPYNEFGTASKGTGKACRDIGHLLILRPSSILPLLVTVPPTSIKGVRQFIMRMAGEALPYYGAAVELTLERDKNGQGISYSKIAPRLVRRLNPEERARIKAYAAELAPILSSVPLHTEEDADPGYSQDEY